MERPTYKLTIAYDDYPDNPRDWDNPCTLWCSHKRYNLGGRHDKQVSTADYENWDDVLTTIDYVVALPLYLYDHSGITMSTTPFTCRWDSGQVGWITMSKEQILSTYGGKRVTKQKRALALDRMREEVNTYDSYISGEVYCYVITDANGEEVEQDGGYYGRQYAEQDGAEALARWER
jgi:hypothetical protein